MLKTIGIIAFLALPILVHANEYEVVISDLSTGEVQIEKTANESELNNLTGNLINLNDESIQFSVRKINVNSVDAIKKSGGEGGTD